MTAKNVPVKTVRMLAFTAEMLPQVQEGKLQLSVGSSSPSDGSRRFVKGQTVRPEKITGSRGFGQYVR